MEIPWISTDTIESVVSQYVSEEELPSLFPKSVIRKETKYSNYLMYGAYSSAEIVDSYLKQAESLKQALEVFLESESKYNHSYIVEGYHVTPAIVSKLKSSFEIKSVFLGRENKEDVMRSITTDASSTNWVVEKTENPETFNKITDMIIVFSEKIKQEAQNHNQQYYSVDGDFETKLHEAVSYLK